MTTCELCHRERERSRRDEVVPQGRVKKTTSLGRWLTSSCSRESNRFAVTGMLSSPIKIQPRLLTGLSSQP